MAEDDYEIDVYGDAQDGGQEQQHTGAEDYGDNTHMSGAPHSGDGGRRAQNGNDDGDDNGDQSNDQTASGSSEPQQGVKRKSELDERPVDPNALAALLISELQWWNTEDEVRNWVHDAGCEDELKEITFSEHKVNGKSKGQAYVELASSQAATATKRHIESTFSSDENGSGHNQQRRPTVAYQSPGANPFKTLPKDAPQRARDNAGRGTPAGPGNFNNNGPANNFQAGGGGGGFQGGFRGRGGYGNRGGLRGGNFNPNYGNSNMNAFNNNNNNMGGGFNNPMGGGGFGGPGFNRGGGMGGRGAPGMGAMRGGRGGMMGGPGMNGMGMGGMPNMGMGGMPNMGMGMMNGMGFNGMPNQFPFFGAGNQGGYGGNQAGGGGGADWGNPHGTKRPRGE